MLILTVLNSFYHTAKDDNRCLVVSLKQAVLLKVLDKDRGLTVPDLNDADVLIFRKSKKTNDKWEKQWITKFADKIVDGFEASKRQCKMFLLYRSIVLKSLLKSNLKQVAAMCYLLRSLSMEIDFEKTQKLVIALRSAAMPRSRPRAYYASSA